MTAERSQVGWSLWLCWVLASAFGNVAGWVVVIVVYHVVDAIAIINFDTFGIVACLALGSFIGCMQWFGVEEEKSTNWAVGCGEHRRLCSGYGFGLGI